jgi:hypothetical protein
VKSFSSTSFANAPAEVLESALAAVRDNPQALFTDFQWFLYEGKDTVFYTAFSKQTLDKESLTNIVAEMVNLAPQLTHGFVGARPGQPFPKHLLDAITSVEYVDEFDGYPDKWLSKSGDIFDHPDLPLFRVMAAVRKGGPDANGRASIMQVRSSHALMEGSDSALLTRSANAAHGTMSDQTRSASLGSKLAGNFGAWMMMLIYVVLGSIIGGKDVEWGFATLPIERHRLRALANRLHVRQRSLMFALVTYALNGDGPKKHMHEKVIGAHYTMLDSKRHDADDDFFRVRALEAKFTVKENFVDFVREVDAVMGKIEQKDITKFQITILGMFGIMRSLNRLFRGFPGKRFWKFNPGGIVLTLVPPHRTYGPITEGMVEPIFCGAWHPGANIVTFCPGRQYLALSFSMEQRHIANVGKIAALLDRIEAETLGERVAA